MRYRAGRYSFCVTGDDTLTGLLPFSWEKYRMTDGEAQDEILLTLEQGLRCRQGGVPDGWSPGEEDFCICYTVQGKTIFELQYDFSAGREVTVRLAQAAGRYVCLGIQYGMLLALHSACIGLHGVTLLCRNKIVVLSAPSGTGKTTLSHLLEKYCDALVINGDFALLSFSKEGAVFEPTPFCGTSRRCLNHRVRIDRVVFLEQSVKNRWQAVTGRSAMRRFLNNVFVPSWDPALERAVQDNAARCISCVGVNSFSFAPEREAAEMFYSQLN